MKKMIAALMLCLVSIFVFGEVKEQHASFPYYEYVVTAEGTSSELKNKILNWTKAGYDRSEFIVKSVGESVVIDGNAWISKGEMGVCPVTFHFTMTFEFKNGRFKCVTEVTEVMVKDGLLAREVNQIKQYSVKNNTSRRNKDIETFRQKLMLWLDDASYESSETPESDW